jgi:acyl-CoA reductase-like NAD-dependent aldehyde dehydrogenase
MLNQPNTEPPIHETMLIAGERVDATGRIEVRNPARPGDLVGTIPRGTPEHVDRTVAAAKKAQPAWAAHSFTERSAVLQRAIEKLAFDIDKRATLFVRENGKTLAEAKGELLSIVPRQKLALGFAPQLEEERSLTAPKGRTFVAHRPYGVVVSIVPWNAPVSLAFTQVVAALLAGNCVVLKPPESCPLAVIQSVALFADELPPGAVNIVTGLPSEIGHALTTHSDVGKIGFTGSIPSARRIMANAAQTIKGVTLELGGNDPAILLDDADFGPGNIGAIANATFSLTGQVCMAIKRIYVPSKRADEFIQAFAEVAGRIVVGDGLEPGVTMGPLHTRGAQENADAIIADAKSRGAWVQTIGEIDNAATFAGGYFMQPTVVANITDDAKIMMEEQFCAAIPIATYNDLDEVIERANKSVFGLSASVWGRDTDRAVAIARRIEAGQVWVNGHGVAAINHMTSYGGIKQSGIGQRSGLDGILEYLQRQTITTNEGVLSPAKIGNH